MTLINRIEATQKLWKMLCPQISLPADTWIARWCSDHPDAIIEAAVTRVSQKFEYEQLDDDSRAHRYATSVLRNIAAAEL